MPCTYIEIEGNKEDLNSFVSLNYVEEEDFICNIQGEGLMLYLVSK
jgi:hypothetical protein